MHYTHYGKQADVWKHLVLCELLSIEEPHIYIETNSAYAEYKLDHTPEQEYGIYHFIRKAIGHPPLRNSVYYSIEKQALKNDRYIGSPGLAMEILGEQASNFMFFDIVEKPLENIVQFASEHSIGHKVKTFNEESISGTLKLISSATNPNTFIHIDPYEINVPNDNGDTYFDVFIKATQAGFKTLLWYGFQTLNDKKRLDNFIERKLRESELTNAVHAQVIMDIIEEETVSYRPGVFGSGLIASNICWESARKLLEYNELLVEIYKDSSYKGMKGSIYRKTFPGR